MKSPRNKASELLHDLNEEVAHESKMMSGRRKLKNNALLNYTNEIVED